MCTVAPLTVQLPAATKETASPELAVAETVKSGSRYVLSASPAKVMVWFALLMANVRCSSGAAWEWAWPACDARTEQAPAPLMWSVAGDVEELSVQAPESTA